MRSIFSAFLRVSARLQACASGTVATAFAIMLPLGFAVVGLALDYSNWNSNRSQIQNAADGAALAAARELRIGNSNMTTINQVAQNFAQGALGPGGFSTLTTSIPADHSNVTVQIVRSVPTLLAHSLGLPFSDIQAKARARVVGGSPLCILSLDPTKPSGLAVSLQSKVSAQGCTVYSNSTATTGISVLDTSQLLSGTACSAGGASGPTTNYNPAPRLDCPVMPDPLAGRAQPAVPSICDYNNTIIVGGTKTLLPGTYCGGINVTAGANVTFSPGVYIIKDGLLTATLSSKLTGAGVGFFMTGAATYLLFGPSTTIDFSAPIAGAMAGILLWEDRAAPLNRQHIIASDHAHNILGTIYLPRGQLIIASKNAVADASFYTILVANWVNIAASPNLVINTNYNASTVPVPSGLGPNNSTVALDN